MKSLILFLIALPGIALSACPHEDGSLVKFLDPATWDAGKVPEDGERVVIEKPMLLDGETARLKSVDIRDGGKLVFDPTAELAKITTDQITIDAQGEMHIGSSDCKFEGKAEVLLTGTFDPDVPEDPDFGRKFIGVKADGVLEIHGKDKKSFTQLAKTLTPHEILFEEKDERNSGIVFYEFDRDTGKLINDFQVGKNGQLELQLTSILAPQPSSVIIMASRGGKKTKIFENFDVFVDILEANLLPDGSEAKFSEIRNTWASPFDAFTVIIDRAPDGKTVRIETYIENIGNDEGSSTTGKRMTDINGIRYFTTNTVSKQTGWANKASFEMRNVVAASHELYDLELVDDVSTWQPGDKLVIASTDFDFKQAEEVEIASVDGNRIQVRGEVRFTHFGEIYETIDMRAEVGLLTRNILIHGEMGEECLDANTNACKDLGFDNYGGHTKALRGFGSYNIEGAELTNMGQLTVLGSYPIHFHMCHDTDDGKPNPLIQSNSIHHCFSRCVTIHGSHGVHVKDNVAHDTYGHCFFLEDGGEKRTVFEGNLGLTTRNGYLVPSDSEPSTFWLTSPLVTMIGNHAAGSAGNKGIGIWYLFPDKPVGESAGLGFFKPKEAKHTPISEFRDNVAHSNGRMGLGVFRRLRQDHGIVGCSTYDPRAVPTDKNSEVVPAIFNGLTAYKNREANAKLRVSATQLINFKLADSKTGVLFNRIQLNGYQMIKDSLIIGETPNVGKPAVVWVNEGGKKVKKTLERSVPTSIESYLTGIYLDSEGPVHVHNVEFKGFKTNEFRPACGFQFQDGFRFGMGPASSVKGLKFDFEEPEALRVCHKNMVTGRDEDSMIFKDLDGSLTGTAGLNVVADFDEYLQEGLNCQPHAEWNMTVCEGDFARFYMWPKPEEAGATVLTKVGETGTIDTNTRKRVSYMVRSDVKVVVHFTAAVPKSYKIRLMGVKKGSPVTIGFCLPQGAEEAELGQFLDFSNDDKWNDDSDIIPAESMDDLEQDTTGKNVYLDKENRILFVKFAESKERDMEKDFGDCPGGLSVGNNCPWVVVNFKQMLDQVDLSSAQCF